MGGFSPFYVEVFSAFNWGRVSAMDGDPGNELGEKQDLFFGDAEFVSFSVFQMI